MLIVVVVLQYVTSYNCDFEWIHYYDCLCIFIYIPCAQLVCQENLKRFLSNMKHVMNEWESSAALGYVYQDSPSESF